MNSISLPIGSVAAARCADRGASLGAILFASASLWNRRFCCLSVAVIAIGLMAPAAPIFGGTFGMGDLVVTQTGATGSSKALTSNGTASFLDEYSTAGSLVQQLALPTATSGLNNPLTIGGTAASEGELSLSANGQYLVVAGYDVGVGGTTQGASTVGLIDSGGNINTTTTTDLLSGNNTRGAASLDGNEVWVTGPEGLVYATTGSSGANIDNNVNFRAISVVPAAVSPTAVNELLASSNKSTLGVLQFTPALPVAATKKGPTAQVLPGMTATNAPETYAFFFVNPNTMFVADATDGIQEWTQSAGTWSNVATLSGSYVGLTGVESGSTVTLYATTGTSAAAGRVAGNSLVADTFTFNSGTSGAGTFGAPTTLATATANSEFSGVAFAPVNSSVGYATIDNSGGGTFNGNVVTVSVPAGSSYAGTGSEVISNLHGKTVGGFVENSVATILAGNNSGTFITGGGAASVSMTWRNQTLAETPAGNLPLISDVVNLYGMSSSAGSSNPTAIQTDPFVLQLTFNPATLQGPGEAQQIAQGNVFLAWLNPNGGGIGIPQWQHANTGDFGGTNSAPLSMPTFIGSFLNYVNSLDGNPAYPDFTQTYTSATLGSLTNDQLDEILGTWGVDATGQDAWAVVNHNSDFAVVPEPSAFLLAAFGAVAGLCRALHHRMAARAATARLVFCVLRA
jgi:hypothetical protein